VFDVSLMTTLLTPADFEKYISDFHRLLDTAAGAVELLPDSRASSNLVSSSGSDFIERVQLHVSYF
jgi:hypothetical protein